MLLCDITEASGAAPKRCPVRTAAPPKGKACCFAGHLPSCHSLGALSNLRHVGSCGGRLRSSMLQQCRQGTLVMPWVQTERTDSAPLRAVNGTHQKGSSLVAGGKVPVGKLFCCSVTPTVKNHRIFQVGRDPQGPSSPTPGST